MQDFERLTSSTGTRFHRSRPCRFEPAHSIAHSAFLFQVPDFNIQLTQLCGRDFQVEFLNLRLGRVFLAINWLGHEKFLSEDLRKIRFIRRGSTRREIDPILERYFAGTIIYNQSVLLVFLKLAGPLVGVSYNHGGRINQVDIHFEASVCS